MVNIEKITYFNALANLANCVLISLLAPKNKHKTKIRERGNKTPHQPLGHKPAVIVSKTSFGAGGLVIFSTGDPDIRARADSI